MFTKQEAFLDPSSTRHGGDLSSPVSPLCALGQAAVGLGLHVWGGQGGGGGLELHGGRLGLLHLL
eukprot:scaffold67111_cov18-Tisochrysis_lutea.AAC.3